MLVHVFRLRFDCCWYGLLPSSITSARGRRVYCTKVSEIARGRSCSHWTSALRCGTTTIAALRTAGMIGPTSTQIKEIHMRTAAAAISFAGSQLLETRHVCAFFNSDD